MTWQQDLARALAAGIDGESFRLHLDWWAKCRTCRYWQGDREVNLAEGACSQPKSPFATTSAYGYCPWWDSFDVEAAFYVIDSARS